jgi:hypothetical protein
VVEIRGSSGDWVRLLIQALSTENTTIRLAENLDMDLSGYDSISITQGVNLTSEWPRVIGNTTTRRTGRIQTTGRIAGSGVLTQGLVSGRTAQKLGPRIYTTTRPRPLFMIRCGEAGFRGDNVRLFGFRLQGPHFGAEGGDDNLEQGIHIDSCINIEIANMEFSGWSGQSIYIGDEAPGRQLNPEAVKIHDNFFHHNQHDDGNGYGVDVSDGAYAFIEHNVFDFNRHAVRGSGVPGTGYRANENLVLKGGGVHCPHGIGVLCGHTQQFDVHGDKNCPDTPLTQHLFNCGNAGDQFWFTNNTFQYVSGLSIKLRGTPLIAAYINGNVFAKGSVGDAVELNGDTNVTVGANTAGADTYGTYGVCDFDGDGQDDLFLATGRTWWYSSAGKMNWVFLKSANETLDQIGLGYFNNDHRCDVLRANANKWEISSAGNQAWTELPGTYSIPFPQLRFADFDGDGITDIFRCAPDGSWSVISPGIYDWRNLQSSSFPLSEVRFGDFDGDHITDVLSRNGGHWSISRNGTGSWQTLNYHLNTALDSLLIGDISGDGIDDIIRFNPSSAISGAWEVSWGGRTDWVPLKQVTSSAPVVGLETPRTLLFIGRFDSPRRADLLFVDWTRLGQLYSTANNELVRQNLYPY